MKQIVRVSYILLFLLVAMGGAHAQEIWGMSTLSFATVKVSPTPQHGFNPCGHGSCWPGYTLWREISAYADTEEDYTASLYYDVTSSSAIYTGGDSYARGSQSFTGNPSASGSFLSGPIMA